MKEGKWIKESECRNEYEWTWMNEWRNMNINEWWNEWISEYMKVRKVWMCGVELVNIHKWEIQWNTNHKSFTNHHIKHKHFGEQSFAWNAQDLVWFYPNKISAELNKVLQSVEWASWENSWCIEITLNFIFGRVECHTTKVTGW